MNLTRKAKAYYIFSIAVKSIITMLVYQLTSYFTGTFLDLNIALWLLIIVVTVDFITTSE